MKNIFLVHSPITFLVSKAVIEHLGIPDEDVLMITNAFTNSDHSFKMVDISSFYCSSTKMGTIANSIRFFNRNKLIDSIIDGFVGSAQFNAYVPVLNYVEKIVVTHEKCANFNFIEEGLVHYFLEETIDSHTVAHARDSWRTSSFDLKRMIPAVLSLLRGYSPRLQSLPFSYSCYANFKDVNFFGITEEVFPLANPSKKHVVKIPDNKGVQSAEYNFTDSIIYIGDCCVDFYNYSCELYLRGIEQGLITYLKQNNISQIFIKFHRLESEIVKQAQRNLFVKFNIHLVEIPNPVIMELALNKSANSILFGTYSSLLYYASIMGHSAYSIYGLLEDKEKYKGMIGRNMDFYWEKVALLNVNP
ncbi:polysialyltransferase family glycosyltransferase [Pedobacter sp. B4-66]|uniref:polysialyltransferase family glycosyltransferase n=1 Tax=Pedobacter sp. B4-66 TaxID=2817280 RepID=UPI001BDB6A67